MPTEHKPIYRLSKPNVMEQQWLMDGDVAVALLPKGDEYNSPTCTTWQRCTLIGPAGNIMNYRRPITTYPAEVQASHRAQCDKIARLREALVKYGRHHDECQLNDFHNVRRKCTCGYDQALNSETK